MNRYSSVCDDYYITMTLNTEMELPNSRDTVLHHFEQIRKKYSGMRNFYCRDKGDFVLEEDKDQGHYRWTTVEPRRLCSGAVNPADVDAALEQHRLVLATAPFALSISPLDCEALDLLYGFDFTYRGNHNELVAEALGVSPALERLLETPGSSVVNYEPSLTLALDEDCRMQVRVSVETRTNAYQIRTRDFPEDQVSVYVSARQYGSLPSGREFTDSLEQLNLTCQDVLERHVIAHVLQPLQRTIALK